MLQKWIPNRSCLDEINKYVPSEIICNENFTISGIDIADLKERMQISIAKLDAHYFDDRLAVAVLLEHFHTSRLSALGLEELSYGKYFCRCFDEVSDRDPEVILGTVTTMCSLISMAILCSWIASTRRNLELVETLREKQKRGSLLWVLDKTKTAMGARMLRSDVEQPLINADLITDRLDAVDELLHNMMAREELREYLNPIYDLERLNTRIVYQTANPRDLIWHLKIRLPCCRRSSTVLADFKSKNLVELSENIDSLSDICADIDAAICEEPPISSRDGGILKDGYNEEVDRLRKAKTEGKKWLAELEAKERETNRDQKFKDQIQQGIWLLSGSDQFL